MPLEVGRSATLLMSLDNLLRTAGLLYMLPLRGGRSRDGVALASFSALRVWAGAGAGEGVGVEGRAAADCGDVGTMFFNALPSSTWLT
jgi:hypothetical protein